MTKLLHIAASPRPSRSYSRPVADAFVEAYAAARPDHTVETLDLWTLSLPEFDGDMLAAKYAVIHQDQQTAGQAAAWVTVTDIFEKFASADFYVISTPMWNFGIPYKLKHYIDLIAQPGLAFGFEPERGYFGLMEGKRALVVCARGDEYRPGSDAATIDFQKPYLLHMLTFFGITDVHQITVEPTIAGGPDSLTAATAQAAALAKEV